MGINTRNTDGQTIKAVETSIEIIDSLKQLEVAKVPELAEVTGKSKANVYKHLNTLQKHGFVQRDNNEYRLGLQYLDLGGFVREQIDGSRIIKPRIAEVAKETGEVCQYMVRNERHAVIVYKESGHQGVSTRARLGTQYQLHRTASGKIMLAHMSETEIEGYIKQHGLPAATEKTITDEEEIYEKLKIIRENKYAINNEESTTGLYTVAVPVTSPSQDILGTCAVSGPVHRMEAQEKEDEIIRTLLSISNEIELNLAHS